MKLPFRRIRPSPVRDGDPFTESSSKNAHSNACTCCTCTWTSSSCGHSSQRFLPSSGDAKMIPHMGKSCQRFWQIPDCFSAGFTKRTVFSSPAENLYIFAASIAISQQIHYNIYWSFVEKNVRPRRRGEPTP